MADEGDEVPVAGSKGKAISNQAMDKKEGKSSMLMQSPRISSQFASPLSSKRSSSDSEQSFRCKRTKLNGKARKENDDVDRVRESCSRSSKEDYDKTKELEKILKDKEELLRKLKLVKMYRAKNNLNDLEELIKKWRSISQQAAQDLFKKFNQEHSLTMGEFLNGLGVKFDLIQYSEDEDAFY
ncbi:swi5-dependent recombination DNA repair protein 1 homolog [Dendronephthya gigantea]|uniref:swi5-dependent recombination DNA repair protein 1 homolog n=1 Tax=Dendronephthya gigantea TaxID=151771 RepID=UPI0010698EF4|nr:swi5-dependent recombination DNA repair protein 1 homolog [Dendronephthya gigantea]